MRSILKHSNLFTKTHPSEFPVVPVLVRIAAYAHRWIRDPETWLGNDTELPRGLFQSLLEHLFARWPMPDFFASAWLVKGELKYLERDWYCHLAGGGSLRNVKGMPPSITARALHLAMSAPVNLTVRQALRWGQIKALGGGDDLLSEVLSSRMVKDLSNDAIWSRVFEKVTAAKNFVPRNFGIIADTLLELTRKDEVEKAASLLRLPMRELLRNSRRYWIHLLRSNAESGLTHKRADIHCSNLRSEISNQNAVRWKPLIGTKPHRFVHREKDSVVQWQIEELTNQYQLTAESEVMRHCVRCYGKACREERSAVFSLRKEDTEDGKLVTTSHLTIEVSKETRQIVQIRGKWNRRCTPGQVPLLKKWADEMELKL